jgi:hypothetical protein
MNTARLTMRRTPRERDGADPSISVKREPDMEVSKGGSLH